VDRTWKDVMRKVSRNPNALKAGTMPGLLEIMQQNNQLLEQIQKCLEDYLESKRLLVLSTNLSSLDFTFCQTMSCLKYCRKLKTRKLFSRI
jgi:Dynein heavy chain, N-terminal region 2